MMRPIALFCAGLALAACQTVPDLPPPAPIACPPSLVQPIEGQPLLPDGATVPRPTTPEEAEGLAQFLDHIAKLAAWGRTGWSRATTAKTFCEEASNG
jgi:hypothetical protein